MSSTEQFKFLASNAVESRRQASARMWQRILVRWEKKAREAFLFYDPTRYLDRDADIEALPHVVFKGRDLVTLHCQKCDADRNVPCGLAWSLISLWHYTCSWCALRG